MEQPFQQFRRRFRNRRRWRNRFRGKVAVIPSLITIGNLLCGFSACVFALLAMKQFNSAGDRGNAEFSIVIGGLLIIAGMVFDLFDGRVARMTGSVSGIGKELDSLSDLVSFGVAPAMLIGVLLMDKTSDWQYVIVAGGLYTACTAFRLARYNVGASPASPVPTHYFTGLPSPAAAAAVVSLIFLRYKYLVLQGFSLEDFLGSGINIDRLVILFLVFFLLLIGVLMVSQVPFPHLGNRLLTGHRPFVHLFVIILVLFLLMLQPTEIVFIIAQGYVAFGLVSWASGRKPAMAHPAPDQPPRSATPENSQTPPPPNDHGPAGGTHA
jgi:CDP-diacylglycerol---serine O-phosphatidyltransferase